MSETVAIKSEVFLGDCMDFMRKAKDKQWDLAIVDPPFPIYSLGGGDLNGSLFKADWYELVPKSPYFLELQRVSINQIVWGGNYFTEMGLSANNNWIVWYKNNAGANYSMCELAWSSIKKNIQLFEMRTQLTRAELGEYEHPCPKPTALYRWLLKNYAKPGDTILDTHMGSQSSRIAAYDMGFDYTGFELDPDYFAAGCRRFEHHRAQLKMF